MCDRVDVTHGWHEAPRESRKHAHASMVNLSTQASVHHGHAHGVQAVDWAHVHDGVQVVEVGWAHVSQHSRHVCQHFG